MGLGTALASLLSGGRGFLSLPVCWAGTGPHCQSHRLPAGRGAGAGLLGLPDQKRRRGRPVGWESPCRPPSRVGPLGLAREQRCCHSAGCHRLPKPPRTPSGAGMLRGAGPSPDPVSLCVYGAVTPTRQRALCEGGGDPARAHRKLGRREEKEAAARGERAPCPLLLARCCSHAARAGAQRGTAPRPPGASPGLAGAGPVRSSGSSRLLREHSPPRPLLGPPPPALCPLPHGRGPGTRRRVVEPEQTLLSPWGPRPPSEGRRRETGRRASTDRHTHRDRGGSADPGAEQESCAGWEGARRKSPKPSREASLHPSTAAEGPRCPLLPPQENFQSCFTLFSDTHIP